MRRMEETKMIVENVTIIVTGVLSIATVVTQSLGLEPVANILERITPIVTTIAAAIFGLLGYQQHQRRIKNERNT
jgi:ABC-type transport system involved in cytochrome c biogenesis permease component